MSFIRKTMSMGLLGFASAGLVCAAHAGVGDVEIAGFATFGYGKTLTDDQGELDGLESEGSERNLNKFGLRMDTDMDEKLSFGAQILSRGADDYDPTLDWLYAQYALLPNLTIKVGKMRMPLFKYSAYQEISYAYQWITPPSAVYQDTISPLDGVILNYVADVGAGWVSDLTVWHGNMENDLLTSDNSVGLAWQMERDWLTLRGVYGKGWLESDELNQRAHLTGYDDESGYPGIETALELIQTLGATYDFSASYEALDLYLLDHDESTFMGFSVAMDFDQYFVIAEASKNEMENSLVVGDSDAYFLMGGIRLPHDWTVSLTYSVQDGETTGEAVGAGQIILQDVSTYQAGLTGSEAPEIPNLVQLIQGTLLGIPGTPGLIGNETSIQESDIETYTLTTRWDFHPSATFKAEYMVQENEEQGEAKRKPEAIRMAIELIF